MTPLRFLLCITGILLLTSACDGKSDSAVTGNADVDSVTCQALTLPAAKSTEEFQVVAVVPSGAGGQLIDGDYELVAHIRYRAQTPGETPSEMRAAVRLRNGGSVMDYIYYEGTGNEPPLPNGFTASVRASGNQLLLDIVCPEERSTGLGFTASGNTLSLFEGNEEMRFQRQ